MPDTEAARAAIREAYNKHRDVMGGMSMAMLKLNAASGFYRDDEPPPAYAEDDPVWIAHALSGLKQALDACAELEKAITAAFNETGKLTPGITVTIRKRCARIGGCLAEIGARTGMQDPDLWRCSCGRTPADIDSDLAARPWGEG